LFHIGTDNILIDGKAIILPGAILRGDLAQVQMGEYVIIKEDVIVRPTYGKGEGSKRLKYLKMKIGSNVYIDRGSIISGHRIGNNVHIGKNVIIGHRSVLKDNCKILDNSILPPDTIVPPFTVFGGRPAVFIAELPESFDKIQQDMTSTYYKNFRGMNPQAKPGDPTAFQMPQNTRRALAEQERE
jgi:dynactin 5